MKSRIDQSGNPDLLRRKAEELSRKSAAGSLERLSPAEETSRIVHEQHMYIEMAIRSGNGMEATKNIRSDVSRFFDPKIPIVAMTAYAMCGDRERFLMAGMNDYISKPLDRNHLAQVLSGIDLKKRK